MRICVKVHGECSCHQKCYSAWR